MRCAATLDRTPNIRHCEERRDEAIHSCLWLDGLLRGACHRAARRADPVARNDGSADCNPWTPHLSFSWPRAAPAGHLFPPPGLGSDLTRAGVACGLATDA